MSQRPARRFPPLVLVPGFDLGIRVEVGLVRPSLQWFYMF